MENSGTIAFRLGVVLGIVLVILGIGSYVLTDFASVTALIPAVFGVLFAVGGAVGLRTDRRRAAAYAIGALAILGVIGSARGISGLLTLLGGAAVDSPIAVVSQGLMIGICLVLLVAASRSVLGVRGKRRL